MAIQSMINSKGSTIRTKLTQMLKTPSISDILKNRFIQEEPMHGSWLHVVSIFECLFLSNFAGD